MSLRQLAFPIALLAAVGLFVSKSRHAVDASRTTLAQVTHSCDESARICAMDPSNACCR